MNIIAYIFVVLITHSAHHNHFVCIVSFLALWSILLFTHYITVKQCLPDLVQHSTVQYIMRIMTVLYLFSEERAGRLQRENTCP